MRPVTKLIASLLGLALLASGAQAQAKKAKSTYVDEYKNALAKLTLTDEQKTKTDALLAEAHKEADTITADAKAAGKGRTDEEKKAAQAKRKELNQKLRSDIDAVLTSDQKKEFKAALAEARKAAKEAKGEKAAAADPAK